jgi:hypothetical protein
MLAFIASDQRNESGQRERAVQMLKRFNPKFLHAAGVSADWGLITINFLRIFDRMTHDIANSKDELADFCHIINVCFVEGHIFLPAGPASGGAGPDSGGAGAASGAVPTATGSASSTPTPRLFKEAMFITERVRRQTKKKVVFHCGSHHVPAWGKISTADLNDLSSRLRCAARVMIDRVSAELQGLRQDFACFAVGRIAEALGPKTPVP